MLIEHLLVQPGFREGGLGLTALLLELEAGVIARAYLVLNPEKLARLSTQLAG